MTKDATPQPNLPKTNLPMNIIKNVTKPVIVEKLPMKAEYALGLGYAARNLDFQVTSTILIDIPYEITKIAKFRMYGDLARN